MPICDRPTKVSGSLDSDFQYAGYYEHATSGLNLTKFRGYDPVAGRWLSRDPLINAELKQYSNLYEYAGNDPIDRMDPDGRFWWIPAAAAAAYGTGKAIGNAGADIIAWSDLYNQTQIYQKALDQAKCHYGGDLPPAVQAAFDKWGADIVTNNGDITTIAQTPGTSMGGMPGSSGKPSPSFQN